MKKNELRFIPRNPAQKSFQETIANNTLTFCFGAAGTGKSHVCALEAAKALENGDVARIILIRPAREAAGENLGYLPGNHEDKLRPYLYPIMDIWRECWMPMQMQAFQREEKIEFWPVAYCRGRTFINAFVIIDEAQNLTAAQMYLVLTRIGEGSKVVVNGDWHQCDLMHCEKSGRNLVDNLVGRPDIGFFEFTDEDVVRQPVVSEVINAAKQVL